MEQRRLLLATFLSLLVVFVWGQFQTPVQPPVDDLIEDVAAAESVDAAEPVASSAFESSRDDTASVGGEVDGEATDSSPPPQPPVIDRVAADLEQSTTIEVDSARATMTNLGGQLTSFLLLDDLDQDGAPLELVRERGSDPYPFALVDGNGNPHPLNDALFEVTQSEDGEGGREIRFEHRSEIGQAIKQFHFRPSGLVELEIDVAGTAPWGILIGPGVRNPSPEEMKSRLTQRMVAYRQGSEEDKLMPGKRRDPVSLSVAGLNWVTIEDNYFLTAVVPGAGLRDVLITTVDQREMYDPDDRRFGADPALADDVVSPEQQLVLNSAGEHAEAVVFLGSKRYDELASLPYGLQSTVRWGFFGFFARPLYRGLQWIYQQHIPNYGWAIVLMTLLIKILFFPLTHKSQKSMAKMQEISPKMTALRNRWRPKLKDRQGRPNPDAQRQMNEEMMAMYRDAGVNPASGCLPILVQIPVFFAFFRVLSTAVELRNAPWIGWIKDLATPDPLYLLPAGMLITSVMLQRMTPPPPDPMQRRIMQLFPVMFGLFAVTFPSGLVLYWMTNNVLTMGQQWFYLRSKDKEKPAERSGKAGSARK